jgi:hypothetical protein
MRQRDRVEWTAGMAGKDRAREKSAKMRAEEARLE